MFAWIIRLFSRKHKTPKIPPLYAVRGGVYVREPNGSAHPIQNLIEQRLTEEGMALFNLRNAVCETLLHDGEWSDEISPGMIEVAIVGRIIIKSDEQQVIISPTIQHVHTMTGRRFDCLPYDHPDFRKPNSFHKNSYAPYWFDYGSGRYIRNFYYEPDEEFKSRKHQEGHLGTRVIEYFTLDVRFYGPEGRILGGFAETRDTTTKNDPIDGLTEAMAKKLVDALVPAIQAHQRSIAEVEIFGNREIPR